MLTAPTLTQLANFSGRPEASYTAFATQALTQASLLFSILTGLQEYPDDSDLDALAVNGICEMADRIYLEQPFVAAGATPFNSETIGSYSYSKGSTATKAATGEKMGMFWWDLAVAELALAETSVITSGSVSGLDRDSIYVDDEGDRYLLGPAELDTADGFGGDVNAELNPRPVLG